MNGLGGKFLEFVHGTHLIWGILWIGLAVLTIALLVLMRTHWGQSQPLGKCVALSLLAHLLLAVYATTVQIVSVAAGIPSDQVFSVSLVGSTDEVGFGGDVHDESGEARPEQAWERFATSPTPILQPDRLDRLDRLDPQDSPAADLPKFNNPTKKLPLPDNLTASLPVMNVSVPLNRTLVDDLPPKLGPSPAAEPIDEAGPEHTDAPLSPVPSTAGPKRAEEPVADVVTDREKPAPSTLPIAVPPSPLATLADVRPAKAQDSWLRDLEEVTSRAASPLSPVDPTPSGSDSTAVSPSMMGTAPAGGSANGGGNAGDPPLVAVVRRDSGVPALPEIYQSRTSPNKAGIAKRHGGSVEAEAAVQAALKWLAANQSADGRWDASQFGAGREMVVLGQDRKGAGANADTGVTGLALLAFLGSGHTHRDGKYAVTVQHGLEYLLRTQNANGSLGGPAETFAYMYCHGIATLALSEAYAMSGDVRLERPVRAAIGYTVAAQHMSTGSWRYQPSEPGDTSQLGWQLMALKSAELAGIEMPPRTREAMVKFLKSVSSGQFGGLAAYRPGERATRTMTAEALVCRQFLGMARENPAADEAGNYMLGELPADGRPNLYYWYYGTLGMYQLQGDYWKTWNKAVQTTLIKRQVQTGDFAGSWEPDCIWGGYGGRIYTTAMSTLCLEVYYRFLPLYGESSPME